MMTSRSEYQSLSTTREGEKKRIHFIEMSPRVYDTDFDVEIGSRCSIEIRLFPSQLMTIRFRLWSSSITKARLTDLTFTLKFNFRWHDDQSSDRRVTWTLTRGRRDWRYVNHWGDRVLSVRTDDTVSSWVLWHISTLSFLRATIQ